MAKKTRGRNQGSVWQRGNRYRAAYTLNGRQVSKSFETKTAAQSWLNEKLTQKDRGILSTSSQATLQEYLTQWMKVQATRLKPKSVIRYQQIARDYVFPHLERKKLRDLTIFNVEQLYQTLLEQGVSIRNVRYVHSLLHCCLKDAALRGLIHSNPAHGARQPKSQQKEMLILDEYQVMQFLMAVKGHRHEALYNLVIKTGIRQGELLGLKWSDVNWQKPNLRIQRAAYRVKGEGTIFTSPKTKSGRRTIPLGNETLQMLQEHRNRQ